MKQSNAHNTTLHPLDPGPCGEAANLACPAPSAAHAQTKHGSFRAHTFSNSAGSRVYKLYVPAGKADTPRAIVVMLHGGNQSADDFAAGTQMNILAEAHGFLVVYPEQAARANASMCWNWFEPQDQQRGAGEPSLIAGIVSEVLQKYDANPHRIFIAGLSAGAAMAVVLGQTYPELFAGIGSHSGLAYGSAHDVVSALGAMKGVRSGVSMLSDMFSTEAAPTLRSPHAVPIIVFHGDRDHIVQQSNSMHIVQQASDAYAVQSPDAELSVNTLSVATSGGRRYSRTILADTQKKVWIEKWIVHGAGHAWSGGDSSGSYTDAGPDASTQMVRFFLALPTDGAAASMVNGAPASSANMDLSVNDDSLSASS